MNRDDRRDFLKTTAAGMLGATSLGQWTALADDLPAITGADESNDLPPHREIVVPGLHAYAQRSVMAGETINFRVSSTEPYQLTICRLGDDPANSSSDEQLHTFKESPAATQPIHPGSYVYVARAIAADEPITALTLECWVRPWRLDAVQGLVTQLDTTNPAGFGLLIDALGRAVFYLGGGGDTGDAQRHVGPKLSLRQWTHVVGTWDGKHKSLWIDGQPAGSWEYQGPLRPGKSVLRLGAASVAGKSDLFFDGDLTMPAIYGRALTAHDVKRRFRTRGLEIPTDEDCLACWPLDEESGQQVRDTGGRMGQIINRGTWMIGGPSFDAHAVPRFGEYDPANDPLRGHALRFASDDLYDCRWSATHAWKVPDDSRPGIYVGRFRFLREGAQQTYDVTFVVRRSNRVKSKSRAPIVVLCSTNTWQAYSATPFAANRSGEQFWGTSGIENSHPLAPAYCCYRSHAAGQPSYQLGLQMPWPVAGPNVIYSPPDVAYSHLMRGERYAHIWLDKVGYEYDVITDLDLHRDPALLGDYKVLLINGHSEYWSIEAYEGVDRFLAAGGDAIVLSGNTMFWRAAFDDDAAVMECRKYDKSLGGAEFAPIGEMWYTQDRRRGSLMRECGYPAWKVIGLECLGWWGTEPESFGAYHLTSSDHFLFHRPREVGLLAGETFGHAPGGGEPGAVGHEADARLVTLANMTSTPYPGGAKVPEEPPGIVTLAQGVQTDSDTTILDYFARRTEAIDGVVCEMIYWERPQGGRVFHAGAIAAGRALLADTRFGTLVRNVLSHFGVESSPA